MMGISPTSSVSIIVPVFNVEPFLHECVESIKAQSFHDFEVIFVDDGSTDNSLAIIEKTCRGDTRFKLEKHGENKGLPAARNTGLKSATGKYIYFLDSDDRISSNTLQTLFSTAETYGNELVIGKIVHWYPHKENLLEEGYFKKFQAQSEINVFLEQSPKFAANVVACHKLILRQLLVKHQITFCEQLKKHEDNPFTAQVLYWTKSLSFTVEPVYYYRQSDSNTSIMYTGSANANTWWKWRCLRELLDQLNRASNKSLNRKRLYILAAEASNILELIFKWNLWELTGQEQSELLRDMREYFCNLEVKRLSRLVPRDVNVVHVLKKSTTKEFTDFIESYYSHGKTKVDPRSVFQQKNKLQKLVAYWQIKQSKIFDEKYYLKKYPDVRVSDIPPLKHFLKYGSWECRSPNSDLDLLNFVTTNFDRIDVSVNPVVSYLRAKEN